MKILLINGYQKNKSNQGQLNASLLHVWLNGLKATNEIQISSVENYNVITEINKFLWADLIIFQFPIYWFNVPAALKAYLDQVFTAGIFYQGKQSYGRGGLLKAKKYITSTTWHAPENVFGDPKQFFEGLSVQEILKPFYFSLKFCGIEPYSKNSDLSFHDVFHADHFPQYKNAILTFIKREMINK